MKALAIRFKCTKVRVFLINLLIHRKKYDNL